MQCDEIFLYLRSRLYFVRHDNFRLQTLALNGKGFFEFRGPRKVDAPEVKRIGQRKQQRDKAGGKLACLCKRNMYYWMTQPFGGR